MKSFTHSQRGAIDSNLDVVADASKKAPKRSVFVVQASCHNPTGLDYSREQWLKIAERMLEWQHFPFFDAAYLGF